MRGLGVRVPWSAPFPSDTLAPMSELDRGYAEQLDRQDPLGHFREGFYFADPEVCYLDGNSLGRLPLRTVEVINNLMLKEWGSEVVDGWHHWLDESETTGDLIGRAALGASSGQVLATDTTSVNFYQLVTAAIKARPGRNTIITDESNFPTDRYILQGLTEEYGLNLILIPNADDELITPEVLAPLLNDDVALVTLQVIQYRSGARNDVSRLTKMIHDCGALTLWDASHAVGSVAMHFDADGVDAAVGCTYKYGNAGPGAPGWLYVSTKMQSELRVPIQGWFAQANQFGMGPTFERAAGIKGFQIATPPIFGLRSIQSSFGMLEEAGIDVIEAKCAQGTELMIALYEGWLKELGFELGTPRNPQQRGGHVSLLHPDAFQISVAMRALAKVIPDFRNPNAIRLAISPLPTSYVEVWDGFARLRDLVASGEYKKVSTTGAKVL